MAAISISEKSTIPCDKPITSKITFFQNPEHSRSNQCAPILIAPRRARQSYQEEHAIHIPVPRVDLQDLQYRRYAMFCKHIFVCTARMISATYCVAVYCYLYFFVHSCLILCMVIHVLRRLIHCCYMNDDK